MSRPQSYPAFGKSNDTIEDGELRWQTQGLAGGFTLLVAHTIVEGDNNDVGVIRIISARSH